MGLTRFHSARSRGNADTKATMSMMPLSPEDVDALLSEPRAIFAPDGTQFVVFAVPNDTASSIDELFDYAPFHYEVRGPGENQHCWLASPQGDFISNPTDDDVPTVWKLKAQIALSGWILLTDHLID